MKGETGPNGLSGSLRQIDCVPFGAGQARHCPGPGRSTGYMSIIVHDLPLHLAPRGVPFLLGHMRQFVSQQVFPLR